MSWKVHETDKVFAALRGLCSNSYRVYAPFEYRYHYDHDCETYECAVEDAAKEYERLLRHCEKQREELAAIKNPLGRLKEAFMESIEGSSKVRAGSSITDELREWAHGFTDLYASNERQLLAIADRIDEQHFEKLQLAWADGVARAEGDLKAFEATRIKLPVDADGEVIRVGDNVAEGDDEFEVRALTLYDRDSWEVLDRLSVSFSPRRLRHVQPDSWERIIADAMLGAERDGAPDTYSDCLAELVERCRRLAGDAE